MPHFHSKYPLPRKRGRVREGVLQPNRLDMRGGPATRDRARQLRRNMTDAEQSLWRELRRGRFGWRFRRQLPIPPYIVDFACIEAGLIIEIDGGQHAIPGEHDHRDAKLRGQGWRVLRFWNNEVFENRAGVLQTIIDALGPWSSVYPHPDPPPQAGEGVRASALQSTSSPPRAGKDVSASASRPKSPPPLAGEGRGGGMEDPGMGEDQVGA